MLQFTAIAMPGENVLTQGAGALNPSGFIRFLSSVPKAQDNPTWNAQGLQPYDTIGGEQVMWSQRKTLLGRADSVGRPDSLGRAAPVGQPAALG